MGRSSSPSVSVPSPPPFPANPNVRQNIDFLSGIGIGLSQGAFLPGQQANLPRRLQRKFEKNFGGGLDLGFLEPLVSLNPEATQQAFGLATRDVSRLRDEAQQNILNQLEANNQLRSSVTGNRLSELNEEFSRDISDIATTLYLADVERSLGNTARLFELGLNTTGGATNLGLGDQQQRATFAQQNFQNQLAANIAAAPQSGGGGLLGGGVGALLGGIAGSAIPGIGTAAGIGLGAGIGGALGAGVGGTLFPATGTVDPGLGFVSGGLGLAGAGAGGFFQPSNFFGQTQQQTDFQTALDRERAMLSDLRKAGAQLSVSG